MREERDFPTDSSPAAGDHIGRLLRLAGPRPAAPHERAARVRDAVRASWQATVRGRRRRRWLARGGVGLAAAAALVALVGVVFGPRTLSPPAFEGPAGRVETVDGRVRLQASADGVERILGAGDVILSGAVIDTGQLGRVAVRLVSGASLRLDRDTRLRWLSDAAVALDRGAVYFDSGGAANRSPIEVRTSLGVIHDVGTQFEVRLEDDRMRVRVREGAINLNRGDRTYDAGPGIELMVDTRGGLSRRSVPTFGPGWDWILAVAPTFELEGRTLDVFLEWVNRETGWSPRFLDSEVEAGAPGVVLHGSIAGMRPDQALQAVLPTCGLVHRLDGGILVIRAEGP